MSSSFPEFTQPGKKPVVNSIFDFSDEALGEIRLWLEQNPPSIGINNIIGFTQQQDVRGRVSSAGAIVSGTGFIVTKGAAGEYTITFTATLRSVPCINVTVDNNAGTAIFPVVANATTTIFQVNTFLSSTGAKTDVGFYFDAAPFV